MNVMRGILHILGLWGALSISAFAQDTVSIHKSVSEYYASIAMLPADTICKRVDTLIAQLDSANVRAAVAGMAYDYFNSSPIMGTEAVSVYVAENYFLNGKLKWPDEATFPWLSTFVEFNKSSLLGRPAPELELQDIEGNSISLRRIESPFKVVYFYEPGCSTCARYTSQLKDFLKSYDGGEPVCLVAVNTADSREAWENYIEANFDSIANPKVRVVNLWDPEAGSLMHKKYGIFTTPMMYLLDCQNVIVGRKINARVLAQLLGMKNKDIKDYAELYGEIFRNLSPVLVEDVELVAKDLYRKVEGDTTLYREVFYNLFNYLRTSGVYALQQGAVKVAKEYIIGEPWYWSEEYMERISRALEKEKLNPVRSQARNLLLRNSKGRLSTLYDECGPELTLVFFHLASCNDCEAMAEGLRKIKPSLQSVGIRVVAVYTGSDEQRWKEFVKKNPKAWRYLWDKNGESNMHELYDLEVVPHLYLLDWDRTIIAKDIDIEALKGIVDDITAAVR